MRSRLLPGLGPDTAAAMTIPFWPVATAGLLVAALSFSGILIPEAPWRQIVVGSGIVSIAGIAPFAGAWPGSPTELRSMLNTGVAMAKNFAVLRALLWLHWPAQEMFGK